VNLKYGWFRPAFGDLILFPFLLVFVRQYCWGLNNQRISWSVSLIGTGLVWSLVLRLKDSGEKTPSQFWLVVGVPLLIVYGMRVALPDTSYDVLNYRLVGAERGLRGWPFISGDFFPPFYPLNPAPDMLFGIFRHVLGYRLGTVLNLLTLLWTGTIINRMLHPNLDNQWLRAAAVLMVLWTEQTLFLINTYLIDLLALPLLLEATYISLLPIEEERQAPRRLLVVALLVGLSAALKILNLAFAVPIALVYLHTLYCYRQSVRWSKLLLFSPIVVLAFLFPLLPYSVYMYSKTANPIFPMYNAIFKSAYWPYVNLYDGRWGPHSLTETLIWPLRVAFNSAETGELRVYSGRISVAIIAAILSLVTAWRVSHLRALSLATLVGSILWSATLTGYARYAIFVEILGGIVIAGLLTQQLQRRRTFRLVLGLPIVLATFLGVASVIQLGRTTRYVAQAEWSQRPPLFEALPRHKEEARFILRDYQLGVFLNEADRHRLADVEVWIESGRLTSGFQSLLSPDAPILCAYIKDYFYTSEGRESFDRSLQESAGKKLGSLCLKDALDDCDENLARRGLQIVEKYPITMFVYSKRTALQMYLLKLEISPR
jgi:hypothetical protein